MTPLRYAALLAVWTCLPLAASAGPTVESAPRAGAPSVAAMAETVTTFFGPQNANPMPIELNIVLGELQRVGKADGPTREQMQPVIERIQLAADEFAPAEPSEQEPAPGLAASVKLELLAGPLRAWLSDGQKDAILRKQQEYGAKLAPQDRQRLQAKMMAWAHALGGAKLGADLAGSAVAEGNTRDPGKEALWRTHGGLTISNGRPENEQETAWIEAAKEATRKGEPLPPRPGANAGVEKTAKSADQLYDGVVLSHGSVFGGGYSLRSQDDGTIIVGDRMGLGSHARLKKGPGLTPTIVVVGSDGRRKTIALDADKDYYLDAGLGRPADWTVSTHFFLAGGKEFAVEPGARFSIEMLPDNRQAESNQRKALAAAAAVATIGVAAGLFGGSLLAFVAVITALKVGMGLLAAYWGYKALTRGPGAVGGTIASLGRAAAVLTMIVGAGFSVVSILEALGRIP